MLLNKMVFDENNMGFIHELGLTFKTNKTGRRIIELIKEGKSKEEIADVISSENNIKWEDAYIDVEEFFIKLKTLGLLND